MLTLAVILVIVLIGLPSMIGGYLVASGFGRRNVANGFSILIYSVGMTVAFAYLLPKGHIARDRQLSDLFC